MRFFECFLLALVFFGPLPLAGQSYQTNFSEMKFDRGKSPVTFHGGAEVDVATGALSVNIPLGPGIGARGAVYVPSYRLRFAPQVSATTFCPGIQDGGIPWGNWLPWTDPMSSTYDMTQCPLPGCDLSFVHRSEGSFLPGSFNLSVYQYNDALKISSYDLPNGNAGTVLGSLPNGVDSARLLSDFGYAGYQVAMAPEVVRDPSGATVPARKAMVRVTSGGGILLGLAHSTQYPEQRWDNLWVFTSPDEFNVYTTSVDYAFPSGLLLIEGDVAYEFQYVRPYQTLVRCLTNGSVLPMFNPVNIMGRFWLKRIRNRLGDEVLFTYTSVGATSPGWTATWLRNGQPVNAAIEVFSDPPGTFAGVSLRVQYIGVDHSSYRILGGSGLANLPPPDDELNDWSVGSGLNTQIIQESNGEVIWLKGALGRAVGVPNINPVAPDVIDEIVFPTHTLKFEWDLYDYPRNAAIDHWDGFQPDYRRVFAYGVTKVTDVDTTVGGYLRVTSYQRMIPRMQLDLRQWAYVAGWAEPRHYSAVTHPDGSTTLYKYFELPSNQGKPGIASLADQIQAMAFMKNLVKEERRYAPWSFDWSNIDGSTPYLTLTHSDLELRRLGNPAGDPALGDMPYTRKTVTVDADTGVTTTEWRDLVDWDATQFGWKLNQKTAQQGSQILTRNLQQTWQFEPATWQGPRVRWEQATGKAAVTRTFDSKNRVLTEWWNDLGISNTPGNPRIDLTFAYDTEPGPSSATLSSPQSLALSGLMGANYLYDNYGYVKQITPKGVTYNFKQTNDPLGRALDQTDPNGLVTYFGWDKEGRLTSVAPPGETPFSYTYDTDHRGVTITRGIQGPKSQLRYNGFGELVLERRWSTDPGDTTPGWRSNRTWGYDLGGRKIWETLWHAGAGSETAWAARLAPQDTVVPGQEGCIRWGFDGDGNPFCEEWGLVTPDQHFFPASHHFWYDHRGRPTQVVGPDSSGAKTTYTGLQKNVTRGLRWSGLALTVPSTGAGNFLTSFDSDPLGRLVKVTDAEGQPTSYTYDDADRIKTVLQQDPASPTRTQTRTRSYNTLGWLLSLTQPESGTTSYSAFDVSGKPWTTSYNGRVVNATFDAFGRVLTLKSLAPDTSVDHAFTWDTAPLNGKGKLRTATANGVMRELDYGGVGGRLSTLTRTVDGRSFLQRVTYDTYGNLSSRTYPDNKVQTLTPDLATSLPVTSVFSGIQVMPLAVYDPVHWGLKELYLANGASTKLTYGADQIRLGSMRHQAAGVDKTWTYTYDDANRLISDSEDWYGYDKLDRLIRAFVRDPFDGSQGAGSLGVWQTFTFDAFGNRTGLDSRTIKNWTPGAAPPAPGSESWDRSSKAKSYTFSATNADFLKNQLPATGTIPTTGASVSTGASYDAQGNLTRIYKDIGDAAKSVTLTYDALGRVKTMADASQNVVEVYTYDDEGLRIMTEIYQGSVTPQNLQKKQYRIYNEARQMVAEYDLVLE